MSMKSKNMISEVMRPATEKERKGVENYINSIAVKVPDVEVIKQKLQMTAIKNPKNDFENGINLGIRLALHYIKEEEQSE